MDNILHKRRINISLQEKKLICEEWEKSGIGKTQFCKDRGIKLSTFHGWYDRLMTPNKKNCFTPIKIITQEKANEQVIEQITAEILISANINIKVKLPLKSLIDFIQELSHANTIIR